MQSAISVNLYFVVWPALFVSCSSFLLLMECPAPSPCTCSGSSGFMIMYCMSKSLTAIPQFGVVNASLEQFLIYLYSNSFTTIPNHAFQNLSSIKADDIGIFLDKNSLYTMESYAFVGFENVTNLQLNDNNFTTIPFAIGTLKQLQTLSIKGNPLKYLDHYVLISIGNSLTTFQFDVDQFTVWPGAQLRLFTKLQMLSANKIPFSHLDANAFSGLENTLTSLYMHYSRLEKIPHAICQLTRLTTFGFCCDSNRNKNISSIFEPCGHTLRTVIHLDLSSNNLHILPDLFSLFPSLTSLDAKSNLFERIPPALDKLSYLNTVNLMYNKIQRVELFDLNSLSKLQTLYLQNNPLVYIAPGAFSHNPEMNYLSLQNTQLDHVPQDVTHLSNLRYLYLSGRPIECNCGMSYLKHWNVSAVTTFYTPCASSTESIKTYIMTSLQSCP